MTEFFESFAAAAPRLWEGTQITLLLCAGGAVTAFVLSVIFGIGASSRFIVIRFVVRVVIEFFRGTSLVVQLFFLFYVLPLMGWTFEPLTTGIIALGLNYGAYGAEVVRGSISAVPKAQWEGTTALSMSWTQKMFRVIWPQAWSLMLPGLNNLLIMLIKGSALASFILLHDITYVTDQLRRTMDTFVVFGMGMVIYFLISLACSLALRYLEKRSQRALGLLPVDRSISMKLIARARGEGGTGIS